MSVDIHTLAGAYALDALDDVERVAFGRHMRDCEACAQEVAEFLQTTRRLADLSATAPPADLRQQVLAEVAGTRQLPPAATGDGRARSGSRPRRWLAAVAAGVAVAAGASAITYAVQDKRVRDAQAQASSSVEIQRVLASPDAQVANREFAGGTLVAVTSNSLNEGVVVLKDLRSPGDRAYQLWMMYPDHNMSMGVLPSGATAGVRLITGLHGADSFGLSEEPPGGSAKPSNVVDTLAMT